MFDLKEKHNVLHKSNPTSTTKEVFQESSLPPTYAANPPDITAGFSGLSLGERKSAKPTRDRCIAHLKLLECFHELRETIATTDGLYGIWDNFVPSHFNERDHAVLLTKIREKRWSIYVAQAAKRFEAWWKDCIGPVGSVVRPGEQVTNPSSWKDDPAIIFSNADLPPIDVLMVWHTYMLNPRDYLADCIRYGKRGLWTNGFPWEAVNACIDNETFEYETSKEAREFFESSTKLPYDSLKMPSHIGIDCPSCSRSPACAWTSCDTQSAWLSQSPGEIAWGFAESSFSQDCHACQFTISHERLRAHKFYKDVQLLLANGTPMPGTLLDHSGMFGEKHTTDYEQFPNHLFKEGGLGEEVIKVLNPKQKSDLILVNMRVVRSIVEKALKDRKTVRKATKATNSLSRSQLLRNEKIAIRRMMACYWENSSPFSLDLVGAVIRQGAFIEKMHAIDWLHSPSVSATMDRLLVKYSRFVDIMGKYSNNVAVPTLDVDLAWHTHQLSCQSYYTYATAKTSTFIDHDDKIEENKLSDAFEWTSKTYQKMFNEVYSECTCWYCESIRESHTGVFSSLRPGHKDLESDLDRLHSSQNGENNGNPHNGPHISAHNAIKTTDVGTTRDIVRANELKKTYVLEASYKKACKRAKREGRQPPQRDQYMTTAYAYGYPIYVPYYAPYMGDPCISGGMYASNPGCANVTAGAAGNCCSGTCGGMVAAGGCGGGGAGGACAGGAAGGCGGGGGGGGGGCGGGGGGGGGCGGGGGGGGG